MFCPSQRTNLNPVVKVDKCKSLNSKLGGSPCSQQNDPCEGIGGLSVWRTIKRSLFLTPDGREHTDSISTG